MERRIEIINSYKFLSGNKNKPLQTRIYNSLTFIIVFSVLGLLCLTGVVFAMLVDWFHLNFSLTWNKSSALVISSILCLLFLAESFYSYLLLKHIKRAQNKKANKNAELVNLELNQIISKQMRLTSNKLLFILGLAIVICALLVEFFNTDVLYVYLWNYLKIPLLIFYVLLFKQVIKNLIQIKRNNILFEITCLK
ncbi:hypothetical protein K5I29_00380 [Flavobacterium agricola]|uniref:Uncharacterized protein n=1 Tax=Flavobacterium agricola TaxID=2870839 RepID=A0ABY6M218_9FLAO|nr:hypothetical protein [Flavobacterium agricola]UYW01450.1 hypothetical protein K5I29_00380 [Flavobacterium agricola]